MVNPEAAEGEQVDLKEAGVAALLAWLVPGLGHFYQGRTAKAILYFMLIMGTFGYGLYLGGSPEVGWGRVVYIAWTPDDRRWQYFCQLGIGLPALPSLIQAGYVGSRAENDPLWHGFMAPPRQTEQPGHHLDHPTADTLQLHLGRFFELGTVFTMVAGLLNLLVIFDAWDGPASPPRTDDEEDEDEDDEKAAELGGHAG